MNLFALLFCLLGNLEAQVKLDFAPLKELKIGSEVRFKHPGGNEKASHTFLGEVLNPTKRKKAYYFLEQDTYQIWVLGEKDIEKSTLPKKRQLLITPFEQSGETCAAYSIFHFWWQNEYIHGENAPELSKAYITEQTRSQMLVDSITNYYLGKSDRIEVSLNKFAKKFNFKCSKKNFEDANTLKKYVFDLSLEGTPVLMEFYVGKNMEYVDYRFETWDNSENWDYRLWIPRKIGDRASSGHAIVAAAALMTPDSERHLMVLDSNWSFPVLWNLEHFVSEKTAVDEILLHSCKPN